jgi:hypothetical protein
MGWLCFLAAFSELASLSFKNALLVIGSLQLAIRSLRIAGDRRNLSCPIFAQHVLLLLILT